MQREKGQQLEDARKALEEKLDQIVSSTGYLLEPLKTLSELQIGAVVTLGLLMQGVRLANRPAARLREDILARFSEEVDSICPPLGKITVSEDPCFEATVQYLLALKKCEEKGIEEALCRDAHGPGAGAVYCTMEEIENLQGVIEDWLGRFDPPRPIPWPT